MREKELIGRIVSKINIVDAMLSLHIEEYSHTEQKNEFTRRQKVAVQQAINAVNKILLDEELRMRQGVKDLKQKLAGLLTDETMDRFKIEKDNAELELEKICNFSVILEQVQNISTNLDQDMAIVEKDALAYAIAFISAKEIDKINIYEASRKAMINALHSLKHKYDMVITDAMPLPRETCKVVPLVKADAKVLAVAAASILAKVARDHYMYELDKKYPKYKFKEHKGYPTKEHLDLLKELGPIKEEYRFSYKPVKNLHFVQLSLL